MNNKTKIILNNLFYILFYIIAVFFSYALSKFTDYIFAGIILLLYEGLLIYLHIKNRKRETYPVWNYIISFIISGLFYFAFSSFSEFYYSIFFEKWINIFNVLGCVVIYPFICIVIDIIADEIKLIRSQKDYFDTFGECMLLFGIIFLFIPFSTMLNNYADYVMSFQMFALPHIIMFIACVLLFHACGRSLNEKGKIIFCAIMDIISICFYVQFNFSNTCLNELNGFPFVWQNYFWQSIFNLILWFIIIVLIALLFFKGALNVQRSKYLSLFLFAIQFVGIVVGIIGTSSNAFELKRSYYDSEEQYTVARNRNTIVFVFDAVDNEFIKNAYENNPARFDAFKDFTAYSNTCSVYDCTPFSMNQMFSGCDFDGEVVADYNGFYSRLHDNGYKVNFYSYEDYYTMPDISSFIDNFRMAEPGEGKYAVSHTSMFTESFKLTAYQVLPYVFKGCINANALSFKSQVSYLSDNNTAIYDNEEFLDNLNLEVGDFENGFIMIHLKGAHFDTIGFEDYENCTNTCIQIASEYISQLKELGLYDEATIILTADHGVHEMILGDLKAATPMFMIKEPGADKAEMIWNTAPIYHMDLLKTILVDADLYYDEDGNRFGTSIYDFNEGDKRTRVWYDRVYDDFAAFTYEGDTSDLEKEVNNGNYVSYENKSGY